MFSKAGYGTQVIAADIGTADAERTPMRLARIGSDGGADGGAPQVFGWDPALVIDSTKGSMNTFAVVSSASPDAGTAAPGFDFTTGVSFAITPDTGDGPYYVKPDESWAGASVTATVNGYGAWFMNLPAGTYTVRATHATLTCSAVAGNGYGWAQTDGSAKAPILAGINTQSIGFFCAPPPDGGTDAGRD